MNNKIKSVRIENFRGVKSQQNLICHLNGTCESVLLFGDNGIGKSSFVDAIEFASTGKIHGSNAKGAGSWIYSSVSKYGDNKAYIDIDYEKDGLIKDIIKISPDLMNANVQFTEIKGFNYAPFILRRRDITDFWNIAPLQRMRFFAPYSNDKESELLDKEKELTDEWSKKRTELKNERKLLLEEVCKYYNLSYSDMINKSKSAVFGMFKLLNHNTKLESLSQRHPMYEQLKRLSILYDEILECNSKVNEIQRKSKQVTTSVNGKFSDLKEKMLDISNYVTQDFKNISKTNDYVSKIQIYIAEKSDVSIEFVVELDNGKKLSPEKLFSEANRDLLALLIFFEFIYIQSGSGQEKVLVMDDIFQSVDATIRFRLMQFLVEKFKEWQLFITTHDRLWKEQLTQLFRSHGKPLIQYEIMHNKFQSSPQLIGSNNAFDDKVHSAIETGSVSDICAAAGYLLEYMSDELSIILRLSVQRKRGDKYTIGDLWPGVFKAIKKTAAKDIYTDLNDLIFLRNIAGCHYNEWSLSLSRSEAVDFANAVLEAYYRVYSKNTGKWIKDISDITGMIL